MTDRGTRRDQKQRNRSRWRRIFSAFSSANDKNWLERSVRVAGEHGKLCSCHMCGNPRKHFKEVTMQEKRADEAERSDTSDQS